MSSWSIGRSRAAVEESLRHSVNVGAYDADGRQLGFLRIVTDRATFAWVCDVYVDPDARGRAVGKALMAECDRLLAAYGVRRALLATADAHGLYAQYGFTPLADDGRWTTPPLGGGFPPGDGVARGRTYVWPQGRR